MPMPIVEPADLIFQRLCTIPMPTAVRFNVGNLELLPSSSSPPETLDIHNNSLQPRDLSKLTNFRGALIEIMDDLVL